MPHVVVLGAGVAGLTSAVALARAGVRVTVLEAGGGCGGRARSWDDPTTGDRVDIGPHVLLERYPNFRALLAELDTEARVAWQPTPRFAMVVAERPFWARPYDRQGLGSDFYDLARLRSTPTRHPLVAANVIDPRRLGAPGDDEVVGGLLQELREDWPAARDARLLHAAVHRVPCVVPAAVPGLERHRLPARTPVARLVLAGDWTDTRLPFSMESAARSGWTAAEEVLEVLGRPRPALAREVGGLEGAAGLVSSLARRLPWSPAQLALHLARAS